MQTFLPYPDFEQAARVLDQKRLGKQRVEVIQVIRGITRPDYGWRHHPVVLMWRGYAEALGRYGVTCCEVWVESGFGDTCAATIRSDLRAAGVHTIRTQAELEAAGALPPWLGDEALHRSHRSALLRKDPQYYRDAFPGDPHDEEYVWPVRSEAVVEAERRRARNAALRAQRALARAEQQAERERRARSRAAKRGWQTRRARSSGAVNR